MSDNLHIVNTSQFGSMLLFASQTNNVLKHQNSELTCIESVLLPTTNEPTSKPNLYALIPLYRDSC